MPTRRNFLTTIAAAAPQSLHAQQPPPNILLVLSDDHSFPFLGAYGAGYLSTPNLDRFARQGMLFDRAFTAAPQCVCCRSFGYPAHNGFRWAAWRVVWLCQ